MYERGGDVDSIVRAEHVALRHVYRCLDVAYKNPTKANKILSGKLKINVNDLHKVAKEG